MAASTGAQPSGREPILIIRRVAASRCNWSVIHWLADMARWRASVVLNGREPSADAMP
ncbi:MAG: hypothetical protein SOR65_10210 [Odoribacter sp.]|nr:hypothetical protein [Odoribacter sp.]